MKKIKKKVKIVVICPACKKRRRVFKTGGYYHKKNKTHTICSVCATIKAKLKKSGIEIKDKIKNRGCTLTEQAFIFTKKEDKVFRIGRCQKYIDCKHRDECCSLVAKQDWQGWKSDSKGFKRLSKKEKMEIYEVHEEHENRVGYLPNSNAHLYKR